MTERDRSPGVKVTTLRSEPFSANVHVVDCGDDVLVVDAGTGVDWAAFEPAFRRAVGDVRRVKCIYCTHWHCDHVGGCAKLRRLTGADVRLHADEAAAVEKGDSRVTLGAWGGVPQEPCPVKPVREGDVLRVGDRRFEVLLVPGHSPAHTALYEPETRSLFGGDLVFPMGSFGRVDFPGGDPDRLLESLARVAEMDVENLYAGHMENVEGGAKKSIAWSLEAAESMLGGGRR